MLTPLRIELFGGLRVQQGERIVTRFTTRKVSALLAHLARYLNRNHAREELADWLWPDADRESGLHNLRQTLASIRQILEPLGTSPGSVLIKDRSHVRLNVAAITTDIIEFEECLRSAALPSTNAKESIDRLLRAVSLYHGELLPGMYEEWALTERQRFSALYIGALRELTRLQEREGDLNQAVDSAERAVITGRIEEQDYAVLMRLYTAAGRPAEALDTYQRWKNILFKEFGTTPSEEMRAAARQLQGEMVSLTAILERQARTSSSLDNPYKSPKPPETNILPQGTSYLPLFLTSFFGREVEMAQVVEANQPFSLDHPDAGVGRLVTLTGPGGTGKTRLAVQVARRLCKPFQDAICFVPLGEISDPQLILDEILKRCGVARSAGAEPLEQAVQALRGKPYLLILDNFEHLLKGEMPDEICGADVVCRLLEHIPQLSLLVTSRRSLGIAGERVHELRPLPLPVEADSPTRLMDFASVQLFIDRAQARRPDFTLTERNAAAVVALCRRLDGIPLAIELAAAQAQTLTPAQMLGHLEHRFDFLVSRQKGGSDRHRSLHAALEWSYRLLAPELQEFFIRLWIFRGGWTSEAAGLVCKEPQAYEYLLQLREHSLVQTEEAGDVMRFRMLETLREFAREQLEEARQKRLAQRHARFFLRLAERAEHGLFHAAEKTPSEFWYQLLETEHDNVRAALDWADGAKKSTIALRIMGSMAYFWYVRGHQHEGRRRLEKALIDSSVNAIIRAKALNGAGTLAFSQSDYDAACVFHEESLALYRQLSDKNSIPYALLDVALATSYKGDYAHARSMCEECLELMRMIGEQYGLASTYELLARLLCIQGEHSRARTLSAEGLELMRGLNDREGISCLLEGVARIAYLQGDLTEAWERFEETLQISGELNHKPRIATCFAFHYSIAYYQEIDADKARTYLRDALETAREMGDRDLEAHILCMQGRFAGRQGDLRRALDLLRESLTQWQNAGDCFNVAGGLDAIALIKAELGHHERAARLRGAAEALRGILGVSPVVVEEKDRERCALILAANLNEETLSEALKQGRTLSRSEAFRYAIEAISMA